jgi:hypothetical protein
VQTAPLQSDSSGENMPLQTKFLIVSNARSGSTWLETMFGSLPDVAVDYEFKWKPKGYAPHPVHMVIPDEHFSCSDALGKIGPDFPVVGSKLVLDPFEHTPDEYRAILRTIGADIHIIHLTRSLTEVYYSWCRGVYHIVDPNRCGNWAHGRPPREVLGAIDSLVAGMPDYLDQLRAAGVGPEGGRHIGASYCEHDVGVLLANEVWMAGLRNTHPNYRMVDYHDIPAAFPALVRYVGSRASADEIRDVLHRPPTLKIPAPRFQDYFANAEELQAICSRYEAQRLVLKQLAPPDRRVA